MNPDYLWLAGATQLLTFFVIGPVLAIAIAFNIWRTKRQDLRPQRYGMVGVASGMTSVALLGFAKWMNADIRTPQYFLQLACVLFSGLLFGVFMGCGFPVLLSSWRWHKKTRLKH